MQLKYACPDDERSFPVIQVIHLFGDNHNSYKYPLFLPTVTVTVSE